MFFLNAYAVPSRASASSKAARRAVSALLVSYQSANDAPPLVPAWALIKSVQGSVRAACIDIASPIRFRDSESNSHTLDGMAPRSDCPFLLGVRGKYLSAAIVGIHRINGDLSYGFMMQDCVIRILRGSVEQTGHEAVKGHTGVSEGFEVHASSVLAALRTRPMDVKRRMLGRR